MTEMCRFPIILVPILLLILATNGKVTVTKFEMCSVEEDSAIRVHAKIIDHEGTQMIESGYLKTLVPIDESIMMHSEVYMLQNENYEFLIDYKDCYCRMIEKYAGEFGLDLSKAAGLQSHSCPIPAGEYSLSNHVMDFAKLNENDVPEGSLRVKAYFIDQKTNSSLGCIDLDFTTGPNV